MATHFNGDISLKNQFETADLIINGKIIDLISTSIFEIESGNTIVHSTYKVEVQNRILGDYKNKHLKLTIVGGEKSGHKTKNTVTLKKGKNYLMLLGKNFGLYKKEDEYVPYYCSCFKIAEDNCIECTPSIQQQFFDLKIAANEKELTLKNAAKGIKEIINRKVEFEKRFNKLEPNELKFLDLEEEVLEMPPTNGNLLREGKIGNFKKE